MFIMTTYKQISAKCLVPAQPAHCDNSLTDKVNKLEGEGERLTRSTRGAGRSRKAEELGVPGRLSTTGAALHARSLP